MKTLQEIKEEYAKEQGFSAWGRLQYDTFTNGEEMEYHMDEVCIRAQKEALEKVSKSQSYINGHSVIFTDLEKQAITNEENLIK